MTAVVNAIKDLARMVGNICEFVVDFFQDLIWAIKMLGDFLLKIPNYFDWLPGSALALIVTTFGVVVVYVVLGRR